MSGSITFGPGSIDVVAIAIPKLNGNGDANDKGCFVRLAELPHARLQINVRHPASTLQSKLSFRPALLSGGKLEVWRLTVDRRERTKCLERSDFNSEVTGAAPIAGKTATSSDG